MADTDIQGTVVDETGAPVEGATVGLFAHTGDLVVRTTTDSNGEYSFDGHPDGDGSTQEWHITTRYSDGSDDCATVSNHSVEASLPVDEAGRVEYDTTIDVNDGADSETFSQTDDAEYDVSVSVSGNPTLDLDTVWESGYEFDIGENDAIPDIESNGDFTIDANIDIPVDKESTADVDFELLVGDTVVDTVENGGSLSFNETENGSSPFVSINTGGGFGGLVDGSVTFDVSITPLADVSYDGIDQA